MFPQSKYIYKILLVALLAISSTSCARWREAKAVVAEADSLLEENNKDRKSGGDVRGIICINNRVISVKLLHRQVESVEEKPLLNPLLKERT